MIILTYHQISVRSGSRPYDISADLFEAQVDALTGLGFTFVTLAEVVRSPPADHRRQCALTFDDGRLGAFEHGLRILNSRGIRATFFICPDWLEKKPVPVRERYSEFMTWEHVSRMARDGHVIGSHGKSHAPLFEIDTESAAREVTESGRLIERRLGVACEHFAAPWGQIDRRLMSLVRDSGYRSLSSMVPGPNKAPYNLYRLRRIDSSGYASLDRFRQAVRRYTDAHARLDVATLEVHGDPRKSGPDIDYVAGFDLIVCLGERAYEFATELGLPCVEYRTEQAGRRCEAIREILSSAHEPPADGRTVTVTPVTLRGGRPAWTFLSSFLPGTSGRR